ncbi:hypothetical protein TNCV_2854171 [Trichonephila clavipes]|uniref:Peptidase M13 N-terminal domain-containing protein n=1 Tax=Trichonephila clavipes TaxID=2585209 RepID=A0A8X6UZB8_TRICX|nr:hypothetical protein TNCV_2854171 [Trichonephila clavipes]
MVLTAYLSYMTKVGVLLGGEENSTRAQMEDVIDFETKLANVSRPFNRSSEGRRVAKNKAFTNATKS